MYQSWPWTGTTDANSNSMYPQSNADAAQWAAAYNQYNLDPNVQQQWQAAWAAYNNSYSGGQVASNASWPENYQAPTVDVSTTTPTTEEKTDVGKKDKEEEEFDRQFKEWEQQFEAWKAQNVNHPDKKAFSDYEKQWQAWRTHLLQKKDQLIKARKQRLAGKQSSDDPNTQTQTTTTETGDTSGQTTSSTSLTEAASAASNPNIYYQAAQYMYMQSYMYPGTGVASQPYYPYSGQENYSDQTANIGQENTETVNPEEVPCYDGRTDRYKYRQMHPDYDNMYPNYENHPPPDMYIPPEEGEYEREWYFGSRRRGNWAPPGRFRRPRMRPRERWGPPETSDVESGEHNTHNQGNFSESNNPIEGPPGLEYPPDGFRGDYLPEGGEPPFTHMDELGQPRRPYPPDDRYHMYRGPPRNFDHPPPPPPPMFDDPEGFYPPPRLRERGDDRYLEDDYGYPPPPMEREMYGPPPPPPPYRDFPMYDEGRFPPTGHRRYPPGYYRRFYPNFDDRYHGPPYPPRMMGVDGHPPFDPMDYPHDERYGFPPGNMPPRPFSGRMRHSEPGYPRGRYRGSGYYGEGPPPMRPPGVDHPQRPSGTYDNSQKHQESADRPPGEDYPQNPPGLEYAEQNPNKQAEEDVKNNEVNSESKNENISDDYAETPAKRLKEDNQDEISKEVSELREEIKANE